MDVGQGTSFKEDTLISVIKDERTHLRLRYGRRNCRVLLCTPSFDVPSPPPYPLPVFETPKEPREDGKVAVGLRGRWVPETQHREVERFVHRRVQVG